MSLKIKFLLIISILLICSTATIFYLNRESFISDKRSYLYSTALERVEAQSDRFNNDFENSFERIRSALQLFDPTSQQFPPQVKALATSQKWGDLYALAVDRIFDHHELVI
ncbi:MAG: hypothetical protein J7501_06000, partial [Bdellovibrio sp.]|nr:hypothetical protein [Bdellovibrio sp.]